MKKSILLISTVLLFVFSNCSNKEQPKELEIIQGDESLSKTKQAIKDYLNKNLYDNSSYDPIEFGDLKEELGFPVDVRSKIYEYETDKLMSELEGKEYTKTLDLDSSKMEVTGYEILHSYRAKNAFGGKIIAHTYFFLSKDYQIIGTEDKSKRDKKKSEKYVDDLFEGLEEEMEDAVKNQ